MANSKLVKTNLLVSVILLIGFMLTAFFSHRANYRVSLNNIEQVSSLTMDGIYYQISSMLTKPVNIALTMAQDRLLVNHLMLEQQHLDDADYVQTIQNYLAAYHEKYHFNSVFLVSTATGRYYNFDGIDRTLTRDNPENAWYYSFLDSKREYSLNVDNDEVAGAGNEIAVFVNCRIADSEGNTVGVVGVGIHTNYLKTLLEHYENKYGVEVFLIDNAGKIQISTSHTGYEDQDWFKLYGMEKTRKDIIGRAVAESNLGFWASSELSEQEFWYIVTRSIPELSWHLLVEQNTSQIMREMKSQIYKTCAMLAAIIISVLVVITIVIKNFNKKITELIEQRQAIFKKATEQLYDNIYEWNITNNCCVGKHTKEYFDNIGAGNLPYDDGIRIIAEKQIKKEFRQEYIAKFSTENIIREFKKGNNHLQYDFMINQDGQTYHWMRIDAHIFYSAEDDSIHMFTYRKNIDAEKRKELLANIDEMTKCYTKKATERMIDSQLAKHPGALHAFFIFDIDNFKQANDRFGHAFGDLCIREFSGIIKAHFREQDIIGRIGGDEFVAFIPISDVAWAEAKAQELVNALDIVCTDNSARWKISASIGVSIAPDNGTDFAALYQSADAALYRTKQKGKNGFTLNRG